MGKGVSLNPSNLGSSFLLLSTQCYDSNSKQVFSAMMMMRKTECTALLLRIDTRFLLGDIFKIHSKGATPIVNFSDLISNFLFKIWVTRYISDSDIYSVSSAGFLRGYSTDFERLRSDQ